MPHPRLILRLRVKSVVQFGLATALLTTTLVAQEPPQDDSSFDIEPPLLVSPGDLAKASEPPATVETLRKRLQRSRENAAAGLRLVKVGAIARVEGEQRELRVQRLVAELAEAELAVAEEQVATQKKRREAGEISQAELDAATTALARTEATAQNARAEYDKAELDAAALAVRRQRRLYAEGSARKSDVARAEDKLAALQQSRSPSVPPAPSP